MRRKKKEMLQFAAKEVAETAENLRIAQLENNNATLRLYNLAVKSGAYHKLKVLGKYYNTTKDTVTTVFSDVDQPNKAYMHSIVAVCKPEGIDPIWVKVEGDCSEIHKNGNFSLINTVRKYGGRYYTRDAENISSMRYGKYGKVIGFITADLHRYVDGQLETFTIPPVWED